MTNDIILVDELDREIGTAEKMAVHRTGRLHRAFSILIVDSRGEMLLQKRARGKYHSGGLWTNACCSHPRSGKSLRGEANRRLFEEMGLRCELEEIFSFRYRAELPNGLVENEYDHVFLGKSDAEPRPDPAEAEAWRRVDLQELQAEMAREPGRFTPWFRMIMKKFANVQRSAVGSRHENERQQ